jgi:DNA repair exonuclease SbcCD ATPase subunit
MQIQKIRIERFKSFYEQYELDFEQVKGLWKIAGSVGSGKTTIGEAILFGLFGSITGKNNGDLVSWGQKVGIVELWCRSNGRDIYIKRTININGTSTIYVEVDREELIFTNKRDAQQQLENEYYDISKVTMELLCIISFNNFKSLATLNTADTKKFLDQVLGFYTLTEYADICKQLRQENDIKLNQIDRNISQIEAQIHKLNEMSNLEIIEGDIVETKNKVAELNKQLSDYEVDVKQYIDDKNKDKNELVKKQASVLTLGKNKKKEIEFIEKGTCPTCGAPIDQSQLEIKRSERDVLLEQYNELTSKINTMIKEMDSEVSRRYNDIRVPISDELSKTKKLLTRLEEQAKRLSVNQEEIDRLQTEKNNWKSQSDVCEADSMSWERLCNILSNDVRARILESFIPALNKNIMKYATELHQPYIVSFDNSFKCSVSLCGYGENIPISSLSTGQLKTVDMMIILGVLGTVIGSSSANVIFLDELFSNLDGGLRNDMCSVLHNFISPDDTMFVISHQDLDERYFNGTLKLHIDHRGQYEKHSSVTLTINEQQ